MTPAGQFHGDAQAEARRAAGDHDDTLGISGRRQRWGLPGEATDDPALESGRDQSAGGKPGSGRQPDWVAEPPPTLDDGHHRRRHRCRVQRPGPRPIVTGLDSIHQRGVRPVGVTVDCAQVPQAGAHRGRFHEGHPDPERLEFVGQRLGPSLDGPLGAAVGGQPR